MEPAIQVIAGPLPGRFATVAHPRAQAWPPEFFAALAAAGVGVLVLALAASELRGPGFDGLTERAERAGVQVVPFPGPGGKPAEESEAVGTVVLAGRLAAQVRGGRFVAVQCGPDTQRSAVLAGMVLVLLGEPPSEALQKLIAEPTAHELAR